MSILSDTDLNQFVCFNKSEWKKSREILIQNGKRENINPMGYDLRVGKEYFNGTVFDGATPTDKEVSIKPGDLVLIRTLEEIKMPTNGSISALILSKVTQVCRGLSNVSTKVDAGYSGTLLISIQNVSKRTIRLEYGEEFCTIIFFSNKTPCSELYDTTQKEYKFIKAYVQGQRQYVLIELIITFLIAVFIIGGFLAGGYFLSDIENRLLIFGNIGVAIYVSVQKIIVERYLKEFIDNIKSKFESN
jgi:dCTP deaminase